MERGFSVTYMLAPHSHEFDFLCRELLISLLDHGRLDQGAINRAKGCFDKHALGGTPTLDELTREAERQSCLTFQTHSRLKCSAITKAESLVFFMPPVVSRTKTRENIARYLLNIPCPIESERLAAVIENLACTQCCKRALPMWLVYPASEYTATILTLFEEIWVDSEILAIQGLMQNRVGLKDAVNYKRKRIRGIFKAKKKFLMRKRARSFRCEHCKTINLRTEKGKGEPQKCWLCKRCGLKKMYDNLEVKNCDPLRLQCLV